MIMIRSFAFPDSPTQILSIIGRELMKSFARPLLLLPCDRPLPVDVNLLDVYVKLVL